MTMNIVMIGVVCAIYASFAACLLLVVCALVNYFVFQQEAIARRMYGWFGYKIRVQRYIMLDDEEDYGAPRAYEPNRLNVVVNTSGTIVEKLGWY